MDPTSQGPRAPDSASLPAAFLERLGHLCPGEEGERVRAALATPLPVALRANTLRAEPAALCAELEGAGLAPERVPWSETALLLPPGSLRALQETQAAKRGALYVQGLASQTAAPTLDPRPGERVLDLAAAPGGKTTHLAARMGGEGELWANDRSRPRFFRMKAVCAGQGVEARLSCRPGEAFGRLHPGAFDRVLLDAPCSGEGRFRLDRPERWSDWKPSKVKRLVHEQGRLLMSAWRALKPGGVLVYATCTLAPEENEGVLTRFLRRVGEEARLEPIALALENARPGLLGWKERRFDPALEAATRLLPTATMEGFFLARLGKRA